MKKLILALLTLSSVTYALDTQLNLSSLGLGVGLSQSITDNLSIVSSIDYIGLNNFTIIDEKYNVVYGTSFGKINATINSKNTMTLNNLSIGLGFNYNLISINCIRFGIEGGIKYNNYNYSDSSTNILNASVLNVNINKILNNTNFNVMSMNKIAPYTQLNFKGYLNKSIYVGSSLGAVYDNFSIKNKSTKQEYISIPFMPIISINVGYSF
jgi:hypothetical protein